MSEARVYHRCLCVITTDDETRITERGHESLYDIDVTECDRAEWVTQALKGGRSLTCGEERKTTCSELKRDPLKNFIREKRAGMVSGIRKDQSIS